MVGRAAARPIRTEVLPSPPATTLGESSRILGLDDEPAKATPKLYQQLLDRRRGSSKSTGRDENSKSQAIPVVLEWPEERRLRDKGKKKSRSLVIWVQPLAISNTKERDESCLYIPSHLIPSYPPVPLFANLFVQDPIELSLAVLQPILGDEDEQDDLSIQARDLDFRPYFAGSEHDDKPNGHGSLANGHGSSLDDSSSTSHVVRQGHTLRLRDKAPTHQPQRHFKILMLEPVSQGVLTAATRIIISTDVLNPHVNGYAEIEDDLPDGHSSHGKTHISLADFDPDAFLSSSLALALQAASPGADADRPDRHGENGEMDMSNSISSDTSGSITPRPPGTRALTPPSPAAPADEVFGDELEHEQGTRFSAIRAGGRGSAGEADDDVCWMSVGGLGRAGVFEGDWVYLHVASEPASSGRLVKVLAWERLDEPDADLPANPIIVPPCLHRSLFPKQTPTTDVIIQPTPFGARQPTLPTAKTLTLVRLATTEGVDKRYERSWITGLRRHFQKDRKGKGKEIAAGAEGGLLVKRGDIIAVPIWLDKPITADGDLHPEDDLDSDDEGHQLHESKHPATGIAYFLITSLSYDPLVPLDEDFRSSLSSKARAGELGCWADVGEDGITQMVLTGMERGRVAGKGGDREWQGLVPIPKPFNNAAATQLRELLSSSFSATSFALTFALSILIKGARGAGKRTLVQTIAEEIGFNVFSVECYDIVGESQAVTEGNLLAQLEKARSASPSILLLNHVEALAKKSESSATGRAPSIVKVLDDVLGALSGFAAATGWPGVLIGTTVDEDSVPKEVLGIFKQDITLSAPSEPERLAILEEAFRDTQVAPDTSLKTFATQTAALQAGDIKSLALRAHDIALQKACKSAGVPIDHLKRAGLPLTTADISKALDDARASYSDSIGAPKIPNVSWDDVGGLASVKADILDTIQLPLEHPELFAEGLKKRSGILLYGPPGTGKTLLAKAVATSCSLNFFSVKGPELLNMYIGESEANVRRVFQKARDAQPCVIFMDELDSIAPKRGNQGDSGGVMDRIVSQLLAELDGMASGKGGNVYVLGATNRPDLLDPALLRPGRFDRMLYLSVATSHEAQLGILKALTRKFKLDPELDLADIAEQCPFNYTGADFYALCSDAMLGAMTRATSLIDQKIEELNAPPVDQRPISGQDRKGLGLGIRNGTGMGNGNSQTQTQTQTTIHWPKVITPQWYLSTIATPAEIEVRVNRRDFEDALGKLVPSVSQSEMEHYERVQREFKGYAIGSQAQAQAGKADWVNGG